MTEQIPEKYCRNCGADLQGNFCLNCGQKNTSPNDRSIKYFLEHFFEEIFTWDSKFFRSIKFLFIKPGFLSHEYISGRVQRYVSPLKMFLFTSFVLFFIMIKIDPDQYTGIVTDPPDKDDIFSSFILEQKESSGVPAGLYIAEFNNEVNNNITLYIFFIIFIFSILLRLVYIRKKIFYSEHIVFTLHFFTFVLWCFLFAVLTADFGPGFLFLFLYLIPGVYLFAAVRNVYHKTIWKALISSGFLTLSYWFLITVWIMGTIFISALKA